VLITGGTGSFGHAFISHLLKHNLAEQVISVSRNGTLRYQLRQAIPDARLLVINGDVYDYHDISLLPSVDTVVHAAAEKHIDTAEKSPYWVNKINVGGARNIIQFAESRGISRVVALSTDKACNPVNVYGRSKADAEVLFSRAGFIGVRYGNVLGSSGSVVPLFLEQKKTGRLTVTDRRMTRYFMPLSDDSVFNVRQPIGTVMSAVGLVLYALEHGRGGEIFIPEIPSGSIDSLAQAVAPGAVIEEIGIRPGEKLHEELIHPSEADRCWKTDDGVYVLMPSPVDAPMGVRADRVPAGFSYASNHALSVIEELEEIHA
jgi:UDP-N-acetylglucosamine 4,6-dehydratase